MKERFKLVNNKKFNKPYVFDKYLFRGGLILLIVCFMVLAFINGGKNSFYYVCDSNIPCDLELFKTRFCQDINKLDEIKLNGLNEWVVNSGLCYMDYAPSGFSVGVPPSKFQGLEYPLTVILLIVIFIINHLKYNKKFVWRD